MRTSLNASVKGLVIPNTNLELRTRTWTVTSYLEICERAVARLIGDPIFFAFFQILG